MRHGACAQRGFGVILLGGAVLVLAGPRGAGQTEKDAQPTTEAPPAAGPVVRSDAEWRRILTPAQYWVTRQKGTEPPFSGKYAQGHHSGTFLCVGCGAELFSARTKFDSGTGWPSFWQPIRPEAIATEIDRSMPAETRVEVMCRRCGAHLGHVFEDGPPPTGLRFCMNSVALTLRPAPAPEKARSRARTVRSRTVPKSEPTTPSQPAADRTGAASP